MTGNWIPEVGVAPLPRGWQAVRRFDRETGEPVILMRMRPFRRWVGATAAAGGVAALFWWFYALRHTGLFALVAAAGIAIGAVLATMTQEGFTVTPGRMRCGRVWVASGNWRGGTADAAELVLQRRELDHTTRLHLYATHRGGGREEIFADDADGRIALPFADWLSTVAHIPVRTD